MGRQVMLGQTLAPSAALLVLMLLLLLPLAALLVVLPMDPPEPMRLAGQQLLRCCPPGRLMMQRDRWEGGWLEGQSTGVEGLLEARCSLEEGWQVVEQMAAVAEGQGLRFLLVFDPAAA